MTLKRFIRNTRSGRVCQPEDIAKLSAFLASEDGGYVSGHVIHLDGGMSR